MNIKIQNYKLSNSIQLGYVLIIISSILYAFTHIIAKPMLGDSSTTNEILNQGINPIVLAACIYILNGLFFTPIASRKNNPSIKRLGCKNLILLSMIGIAEVSALMIYFFGLKDTTAVNASIFSNAEIIFSMLIVMIIFQEKIRKNELVPFFMIVIGIIILPVTFELYKNDLNMSSFLLGDILIILSGLFYAVDVNISKYVSNKIDAKRITQITSFASGIFALTIIIILDIPFNINLNHILPISFLAFVGTGIATLFFVIALKLLGGVKTILLYSTTSIFGIIFSSIILSEEITIIDIVSVIIVISGIYLMRNKLGSE